MVGRKALLVLGFLFSAKKSVGIFLPIGLVGG